ncbi:hypothetical protein DCO58_05950 [Helicobacter saguini]|uniref:Uncharacterized protein n=1 Tax=Helicobacter saguini TaxID=1548018 RepID=A0A347VTF9_9HELI|nr:hypothetical protein [Helicobacter saguini]MWV62115.1 hypothetical protein [Helicobacter saguini]MWV67213.1 hypothetical protein [Helicobacter saguini]MWV69565.1 hypothetical protein [Helicobacter saguini]MWV70884.1 hypothetical protein [Helicobacter saguini]TLD94285.1 hypothetical protein LS64_006070 [Helicobacter saguini]
MWLSSSDKDNDKVMKTTQDMFNNNIGLDSHGNVILKDYSFDFTTIFDNEVKKIPITDKEFLKQDALRATKLLNETNKIIQSSPYANYKPNYLDPNYHTGQQSNLLKFKEIQKLYYKDPVKGTIAPWTKKEKAYYESLKTKKERYKYLVIRSGLRSAVIDIPFDAIGGVDENGRVINKEYEEIFYQVDINKDTLKSYLFRQEWGIAAGILGKPEYLSRDKLGFQARHIQALVLQMQLDATSTDFMGRKEYESYIENIIGNQRLGLRKNPLRKQQVAAIAKKIKPDKFGMLPYIDEIIGVDWIMDFSRIDVHGDIIEEIDVLLANGLLKDPRDSDSTNESKIAFAEKANFLIKRRADTLALDIPYLLDIENPELEYDIIELHAKIMAVTPPQGYPNAPTYYIPEYLEGLYKEGKLDSKLDPRIPAIYRESFPAELRQKILDYAKIHNIKD